MRYKFYKEFDTTNNITIYDPSTTIFSKFKWSDGYYSHVLSKTEIIKFWLVSYQYYGSNDYEEILLLLNNIENIWDVIPGSKIKIPKLNELQNFILEYQI